MKLKKLFLVFSAVLICLSLVSCKAAESDGNAQTTAESTLASTETEAPVQTEAQTTEAQTTTEAPLPQEEKIEFSNEWEYASFSAIHADTATLYRSQAENRKNKVICINAGHGCRGGSSKKTLCHPDGSPKVTGGSTAKGSTTATSINEGTTLNDGTSEASANLALAKTVKELLLENGYDVLMIRENDNTQLDNIARTVIANNNADCHISLHYDSSTNDKGLFFLGVPEVKSYINMEPVKSHYKEHIKLGESLIEGERKAGVKIFSSGRMDIDLTQTSYSTVPSVDLEVGDQASDHSPSQHRKIAEGILNGLNIYFDF